jgi:hypothetical protein
MQQYALHTSIHMQTIEDVNTQPNLHKAPVLRANTQESISYALRRGRLAPPADGHGVEYVERQPHRGQTVGAYDSSRAVQSSMGSDSEASGPYRHQLLKPSSATSSWHIGILRRPAVTPSEPGISPRLPARFDGPMLKPYALFS